jgi:hypothetical protein
MSLDAVKAAATLREALVEIVAHGGEVCDDYVNCTHVACRSSYMSWAIASRALEACGIVPPQKGGVPGGEASEKHVPANRPPSS